MLKITLIKANDLLWILRYWNSNELLKTICNAHFDPLEIWLSNLWANPKLASRWCHQIKKKIVMWIIPWNDKCKLAKPLFNEFRILTLDETVKLCHPLSMYSIMKYLKPYKNVSSNQNHCHTKVGYQSKLNTPQIRSTHYGFQSIQYRSVEIWSKILTKIIDKLNDCYWSEDCKIH